VKYNGYTHTREVTEYPELNITCAIWHDLLLYDVITDVMCRLLFYWLTTSCQLNVILLILKKLKLRLIIIGKVFRSLLSLMFGLKYIHSTTMRNTKNIIIANVSQHGKNCSNFSNFLSSLGRLEVMEYRDNGH